MQTVSVVIPSFNNQELLDQCLDTLGQQTRPADEIIVVDDGSDPPLHTPRGVLLRRIERLPLHRGSSCAKNTGARVAIGDILIFSDAEVLHVPECIESLLACADEWRSEGRTDILLNVMRINLDIRVFPGETKNMHAFVKYARQCEWIDGRNENMDIPMLTLEQNVGLIRRDYFWKLGGYDEKAFPGWGYNNQDLDLRVAEDGGHVTSHIRRVRSDRRLLCFHNFHEAPISQEAATKEFVAKWGEPFHPSMLQERMARAAVK